MKGRTSADLCTLHHYAENNITEATGKMKRGKKY